MNSNQLKDKLKNVCEEKKLDFNTLLRWYMYDRFLERLAVSKYKNNFILKGGFYLSAIFGLDNRTTLDIDTLFKNAKFNKKELTILLNEIISIDINDDAKLKLVKIEDIADESEYGGLRAYIDVVIGKIKEGFHLDIVVGDLITPKEIEYEYLPILSNNSVKLMAYNIETILAEKLETIFSRSELNSRMKDYYDIYLIYAKYWERIDHKIFKSAVKNTFNNREYFGNYRETLLIIKNSETLKQRWNLYTKRNQYAADIRYKDVIKAIDLIIGCI